MVDALGAPEALAPPLPQLTRYKKVWLGGHHPPSTIHVIRSVIIAQNMVVFLMRSFGHLNRMTDRRRCADATPTPCVEDVVEAMQKKQRAAAAAPAAPAAPPCPGAGEPTVRGRRRRLNTSG